MSKTVMSFYCDDTNPYSAPPEAFSSFLDFASEMGIAGESSVILGAQYAKHGLLTELDTEEKRAFAEQLQRAYACGFDAHMELITHGGMFDFERRNVPEGVIHEGLWLHTADVSVDEYEAYFDGILTEGQKLGVRFTGMTWPGCSCEACMSVYRVLDATGRNVINPNVYEALLNLAARGRFRGRTVPCFVSEDLPGCAVQLMAGAGQYGVYDLPPNLDDRLSVRGSDGKIGPGDPDYYISADGESGCIPEIVASDAPYCIFWTHWWTINPVSGPGWQTFQTVVRRVNKLLGERVVWMRPSEFTEQMHRTRDP
jgi:hypothetical protein